MASQMIFGVSVSVHPPNFLELQIAITGLTLGAETKATCKLGGLTESRLRRHFILLQRAMYNPLWIG